MLILIPFSTLVFDSTPVLNFGPGSTFDSDANLVVESALRPPFNSNFDAIRSSDLNEGGKRTTGKSVTRTSHAPLIEFVYATAGQTEFRLGSFSAAPRPERRAKAAPSARPRCILIYGRERPARGQDPAAASFNYTTVMMISDTGRVFTQRLDAFVSRGRRRTTVSGDRQQPKFVYIKIYMQHSNFVGTLSEGEVRHKWGHVIKDTRTYFASFHVSTYEVYVGADFKSQTYLLKILSPYSHKKLLISDIVSGIGDSTGDSSHQHVLGYHREFSDSNPTI
ncbi:hypothetical protein EVAR_95947_1 [Eumeta japonica]|uniref:Uncharacterized protein n=1 Tax=Eumeta variegata TaxID=151549 RepID=A0A4C1V7N6_EUMVA|nr:hypothetical protein EVAR_95947_1 [Eumeta japonica]